MDATVKRTALETFDVPGSHSEMMSSQRTRW